MPTYDYMCHACAHQFESFQRMADMEVPLKEPCPACGITGEVEKIIIQNAPLVSGVQGVTHSVPDGFRDVIKKIKKDHPLGNIGDP